MMERRVRLLLGVVLITLICVICAALLRQREVAYFSVIFFSGKDAMW